MAGTRPPKGQLPKDIDRIKRLVFLMDNSIRIPGTNMTFGLDPIIGLVPVLGDVVDFLISAGILLALVRNGASGKVIAKMLLNVGIDTLLSAIPVLGNIGDFAFKANQRNLNLAIEHYEQGKHEGSAAPILLPIIGALILMFVTIIGFSIWIFSSLISWISSF
jgi:hypothetical protein